MPAPYTCLHKGILSAGWRKDGLKKKKVPEGKKYINVPVNVWAHAQLKNKATFYIPSWGEACVSQNFGI